MFAYVKMKVLVQSQRFMVFSIIDTLVARHREGESNSSIYAKLLNEASRSSESNGK